MTLKSRKPQVFMWINNPEASAELCIECPKPVKGDQGPDFDA